MNDLVSICIPTYNNEEYIADTIKFVLAQSYKNIELVISDDCSTDKTFDIVKSFSDPRIKAFRNSKNLGMVGNWNKSVSLATGKYIKLLCADDIIYESCIEKEVAALISNPNVVLAQSDSHLININMKKIGFYKRFPKKGVVPGKVIAKKCLLFHDFFGPPLASTFRKSDFDKVGGFSDKFNYILDFDLFLSLSCFGDIYTIREFLNGFRIRKHSNTEFLINNRPDVYLNEHIELFKKHAQALGLSAFQLKIFSFNRKLRSFILKLYFSVFLR